MSKEHWPKPGDKMKFMNRNGYDSELKAAAAVFKEGEILTVSHCDVGGFSHYICFEEHPARGFNGVMFEFLEGEERYPMPPRTLTVGQALDEIYPWGYRSEDKEP